MSTSPLAVLRLPSPPSQYQQGYMARLTNTLELEKQATYFAASVGLNTAVEQAKATAWLIKSILVSEDSGNADTITVTITDVAAAVFSLYKVKAVAANTTVELLTAPLVVQEDEIIKVTAATANRLHVVASLLEIT